MKTDLSLIQATLQMIARTIAGETGIMFPQTSIRFALKPCGVEILQRVGKQPVAPT